MPKKEICTPEEYRREQKRQKNRKKLIGGAAIGTLVLVGFYILLTAVQAIISAGSTEFPTEAGPVSNSAKRLYHAVMDSDAGYRRVRFLGLPSLDRENMTAAHVVAFLDRRFDGVDMRHADEAVEATLMLQQWDVAADEVTVRLSNATKWWWWLDPDEVPVLLHEVEASGERMGLPPVDVLDGLTEHGAEWMSTEGTGAQDNYSGITAFAAERQSADASRWGSVDCGAAWNTGHPACLEAPECWHEVASLLASMNVGVGDTLVADVTQGEGRSLAQIESAVRRYSDCSEHEAGE